MTNNMNSYPYVILGGGLSAGYAAQELAAKGIAQDELCIVSAEKTLPYERPPLSKGFLAGEKEKEDILINDPDFYTRNGIIMKLGTRVSALDLDQKKLFADGETIGYEKLLIATGSRPLKLSVPGSDLQNLFYLRQIGDSRHIRQQAQDAQNAVVVGGSFIGMESAAVLQSKGVQTTMIFPEQRVWQDFFTKPMSAFFEKYYRARGVTLMPEDKVQSFLGQDRVAQVKTTSGNTIPADLVVAGIGVKPNTEIFQDSGLQLDHDRLLVNRFLETNMPGVVAAGDITCYRDTIFDRPMHIEHWDNAVEQGRHAARTMLGEFEPYVHVPYFFSDVFDLSYEFWGDINGAKTAAYRGDIDSGRFSVWWLGANGRLLATFVMNRPDEEREVAAQWIRERKEFDPNWLEKAPTLKTTVS